MTDVAELERRILFVFQGEKALGDALEALFDTMMRDSRHTDIEGRTGFAVEIDGLDVDILLALQDTKFAATGELREWFDGDGTLGAAYEGVRRIAKIGQDKIDHWCAREGIRPPAEAAVTG